MKLHGMKIIVIGAGAGGLSAARVLALRGAEVTLLEQAEAIREVGAGLQISPNGFAVLNGLGLGESLRRVAVRGQSVSLRDYRKGEVIRLDLSASKSRDYYFVHRADLIDLLAAGARESGVKIRLLQKVSKVEPGKRPTVHLAGGATVEADLIIGADGLHSVARHALNGTTAPFFTLQVAWRAVIPNDLDIGPEVRVHMGPHRHVVSYPLRGGRELNIVAVQERAAWAEESWSQEDDPLAMRAAFGDFGSEVQDILNRVEKVNLWGLFRHPVAKVWHGEGVVLLGDAVHPTLPFMAQGACMALEDAWVLAEALDGEGSLAERLSDYQAARENRVRKVVETANGNAWKYHLSFPPLRGVAHLALRAAGRMAPARMMRQFDWIYGHDVTVKYMGR